MFEDSSLSNLSPERASAPAVVAGCWGGASNESVYELVAKVVYYAVAEIRIRGQTQRLAAI